ncbi:MAG: hypothetical protein R3C03_17795 [Pirellulaceae bacterium]
MFDVSAASMRPMPRLLAAPFGQSDAEAAQNQWADYLDTSVKTKNSIGMEMVLIPAGEFDVGRKESIQRILSMFPRESAADFENEAPVHPVRLTRPIPDIVM